MGNIDKAARTGQAGAEFGNVQIAFAIGLRQPQKGHVQAAAIVKIKLAGLIDNGVGIGGGAKTQTAGGYAANHARLGGERHQVDNPLFGGHVGNAFGHADAQIHHRIGAQFHGGATGDDFALAHGHGLERRHGHADFAGVGWVVLFGKGLHVVGWVFGHHHTVHQNARHFDFARVKAVAFGNALHLGNHNAAAVARCHGNGLRF